MRFNRGIWIAVLLAIGAALIYAAQVGAL